MLENIIRNPLDLKLNSEQKKNKTNLEVKAFDLKAHKHNTGK